MQFGDNQQTPINETFEWRADRSRIVPSSYCCDWLSASKFPLSSQRNLSGHIILWSRASYSRTLPLSFSSSSASEEHSKNPSTMRKGQLVWLIILSVGLGLFLAGLYGDLNRCGIPPLHGGVGVCFFSSTFDYSASLLGALIVMVATIGLANIFPYKQPTTPP
jgi:hypothetical protein